MQSYRLYDMPMPQAGTPKLQASIGFFGWILIMIVAALVAAGVAFGLMMMVAARGGSAHGGGKAETPPSWKDAPSEKKAAPGDWHDEKGGDEFRAVPAVRWVEMDRDEGTIALAANTPGLRDEAYAMASEMWPGGFMVVWEKEVGRQPGRPDLPGDAPRTEYHIRFRAR